MSSDQIRVLLVDDHSVVRAGLRAILLAAPDIQIVGEASNGHEAVEMAESLRPNVVIMDVKMDRMDGLEATRQIVARTPGVHVLILTMHAEEDYLVQVVQAGALGYLVKTAADRELISAVRAVARGEVTLRDQAASILARGLVPDPLTVDREAYEKLSDRERLVFQLVASGFSAREIATQLSISAKTVDTYKQRINEKLGITHRTDYVRFARRLDLLNS